MCDLEIARHVVQVGLTNRMHHKYSPAKLEAHLDKGVKTY